jgi:hypothetical protein
MADVIVTSGFWVLILLVLGYALAPLLSEEFHANTVRVFIVLYVTLFGLGIIFGPVGNDQRMMIGDLFASLGLTFFWSMRKKTDASSLQPHSPPQPESQPLPSPHHPDK